MLQRAAGRMFHMWGEVCTEERVLNSNCLRSSAQRWHLSKHFDTNGVISLAVSGTGTGTRTLARIIPDNRCRPPPCLLCERFYIKPYNPFVHVSVQTASVIKPSSTWNVFVLQAIGNRLHELLSEENSDKFSVIHQVRDDSKKRELRLEDEEEDFLDEGKTRMFSIRMRTDHWSGRH